MVVYGRLLIRHTDAEEKQTEHGRIVIIYIFPRFSRHPAKGKEKRFMNVIKNTGRFNSSTGFPVIGQSCCPRSVVQSIVQSVVKVGQWWWRMVYR
jgi:hypothetical protein